MPAALEPVRRVKCTYTECDMSFDSAKSMKRHKKESDEHEYCHLCDVDCASYDQYIVHKTQRPDMHGRVCRLCGDDFRTESGLTRHMVHTHKASQKLVCPGCEQVYFSATSFIEHLEFGHCDTIAASEFEGRVVHKQLLADLDKHGPVYTDFRHKTSQCAVALDAEEEMGLAPVEDVFEDHGGIGGVLFAALPPEPFADGPSAPAVVDDGQYPPLPSQASATDAVVLGLGGMCLDGSVEAGSVGTPTSASLANKVVSETLHPRRQGPVHTPTRMTLPTDFAISAADAPMDHEPSRSMLRHRLWDPHSDDWSPGSFYNAMLTAYQCPFVCEYVASS